LAKFRGFHAAAVTIKWSKVKGIYITQCYYNKRNKIQNQF